MSTRTPSPENQMMQIILGKWISKPVNVAAKLGIPDILKDKSRTIDELAEITNTHPDSLYRMMRALAGVGIFVEKEEQCFGNTPLSECLIEERLRAAALLFHSAWHDKMWDNLLYSIQTGKSSFEKEFGEPVFEWFKKNPDQAEVFHKANSYKAATSHRVIADIYDFTSYRSIVDVGGGEGRLLAEILKTNSHMQGDVAELPGMIPQINKVIKENQLKSRMKAVESDFFKSVPKEYDVYLFSHVLHDWSDDKCIAILKNCRKAMGLNGKLLIIEAVIPDKNEFSVAKLLDLEVLLMGGGRERREEEFRNLLKNSGFHFSQIIQTSEVISILECIPE